MTGFWFGVLISLSVHVKVSAFMSVMLFWLLVVLFVGLHHLCD